MTIPEEIIEIGDAYKSLSADVRERLMKQGSTTWWKKGGTRKEAVGAYEVIDGQQFNFVLQDWVFQGQTYPMLEVMVLGEGSVAQMLLYQEDGDAPFEVEYVSVNEEYRRRGLGTAMWEWMKARYPMEHSTFKTDMGRDWAQSLGKQAGAAWDTGVMVALFPDEETQKRLAVASGEPADRLHLTLVMIGMVEDLEKYITDGSWEDLSVAVEAAVRSKGAIEAKIGGVGKFLHEDDDGNQPYIALVDSVGVAPLREALVDELEKREIPFSEDHGFIPHITLGYFDKDEDVPEVEEIEMVFDEVVVAIGEKREVFSLGPLKKAATVQSHGSYSIPDSIQRFAESEGIFIGMAESEQGFRNEVMEELDGTIFGAMTAYARPALKSVTIWYHPEAREGWLTAALLHEIGHVMLFVQGRTAHSEAEAWAWAKNAAPQFGISWDSDMEAMQMTGEFFEKSGSKKSKARQKVIFSSGATLFVEVADTPEKEKTGLREHTTLGEDEGMLFPRASFGGFTMRGVSLPLSLAVYDRRGTIINIIDMEPGQEFIDPGPGWAGAIEANKGWFRRNKVGLGSEVQIDS